MIQLYSDQLSTQLQKSLHLCYFLLGNEPLLLQESQDQILARAKKQQFNEHFSVTLDINTDWNTIFSLCQALNLFANRQTLLLILPDKGTNAIMDEKLLKLTSLLHDNLILILRGNKFTHAQKNKAWFKVLSKNAVLVNCISPTRMQLPHWIVNRANKMKLFIDDSICQLLCYYYEGNLLALTQILERLSLLYPNNNLTLPLVKMIINDVAHFTLFQWIDAILVGESKRAIHILRQLRLEDTEPIILLRNIQREIMLLLMLKRQMSGLPNCTILDHHNIWKQHLILMHQALERLTLVQLYNAVALMVKIELVLKQDYKYNIWFDLNALTLLLCGNILPAAIFDD